MECIHHTFAIRDGVEDTRLEAKAKDTIKISRPRPRTKDIDASVLQKKRSSKNSYRQYQKKGLKKFFFKRKRS